MKVYGRLLVIAAAGVAAYTSLSVPTASAADSFGPTVKLTLAAGASSATGTATLHLDALPSKVDVALALDLTGSMWQVAADAQTQATQIVSQLQAEIPDARFAVTSFKDYSLSEFGYVSPNNCTMFPDEYPYRINTGFTTDATAVSAAISSLTQGSGCDLPEAYNRMFHETAMNGGLQWDPQSRRFLVVLGDQIGHDPDLHSVFDACPNGLASPGAISGYTTQTSWDYTVFPPAEVTTTSPVYDDRLLDPGTDGVFGTADDLSTKGTLDELRSAGISMLWVHYDAAGAPVPLACHQQLAAYTGGAAVDGSTAATTVSNLIGTGVSTAASTVSGITLQTSPASKASWVTLGTPTTTSGGPVSYPLATPADVAVSETFTVPAGTAPGTYSFDVQAVADGANRATQHVSITVPAPNTAPRQAAVSCAVDPVPTGQPTSVTVTFTDPDAADTHTVATDWGDGTTSTTHALPAGTFSDQQAHTYNTPGTYAVTATVTDAAGAGAAAACPNWLVVYDPNGGFVTGGGSIYSAPGSYAAQPNAAGTATFGFVSRYTKGASTPSGSTQFDFGAAGISFHSNSYQWLVVSGPDAQFKGAGTFNGTPGYTFLLTARDGQVKGGGGIDSFRIKITDANGNVVYDNRAGAGDTLATGSPEALDSGSIVIHS